MRSGAALHFPKQQLLLKLTFKYEIKMHLPLGVPEKTEQKPVWRILRPGREKFLTKLIVLSDNHLFKQNIQQKQLQMNLSTY